MADEDRAPGGSTRLAPWLLLFGAVVSGVALASLAFWQRSALVPLATAPYLLATVGAVAGAAAFDREDRMRWAWLAIAFGNFLGGATCAALGQPPLHTPLGPGLSGGLNAVMLVSNVLLNVCTVAGLVIFAQAWRSFRSRSLWYPVATAIAFAVGAVAAGPALLQSLRQLAAGSHGDAWSTIISSLGDLAAITMLGPLAVTAIAMRGGVLLWPFLLLTLGTLCWLVFDASALLTGPAQTLVDLLFASLGLAFTGAAGVAHRWAIRSVA